MVPSWSVGSSGCCRWTKSINSGCSKTLSTPFWPWCTVPWSSRWCRGLLAGLAYWFLGVPYAVLWGVATAFVSLLPVGGSAIVSIPAAIYLFLQGETVRGVVLLVWCLGFVGTVDNILKPLLIGNRSLLSFFGILGGLSLFGAVGIVLGPALLALLRALLDLYSEEYSNIERP